MSSAKRSAVFRVADEVAGQDEATAQRECDIWLPGTLSFAAGPELGQEPSQSLVVLLLAQQADEVVQLMEADLRQVDLQSVNDTESVLDDDCRHPEELLANGVVGVEDNIAPGNGHTQDKRELDESRAPVGIVS